MAPAVAVSPVREARVDRVVAMVGRRRETASSQGAGFRRRESDAHVLVLEGRNSLLTGWAGSPSSALAMRTWPLPEGVMIRRSSLRFVINSEPHANAMLVARTRERTPRAVELVTGGRGATDAVDVKPRTSVGGRAAGWVPCGRRALRATAAVKHGPLSQQAPPPAETADSRDDNLYDLRGAERRCYGPGRRGRIAASATPGELNGVRIRDRIRRRALRANGKMRLEAACRNCATICATAIVGSIRHSLRRSGRLVARSTQVDGAGPLPVRSRATRAARSLPARPSAATAGAVPSAPCAVHCSRALAPLDPIHHVVGLETRGRPSPASTGPRGSLAGVERELDEGLFRRRDRRLRKRRRQADVRASRMPWGVPRAASRMALARARPGPLRSGQRSAADAAAEQGDEEGMRMCHKEISVRRRVMLGATRRSFGTR